MLPIPRSVVSRRTILAGLAASATAARAAIEPLDDAWRPVLPLGIAPAPLAMRRVAVPYELWHYTNDWSGQPTPEKPWGHPLLGEYASDDQAIVRRHAAMLASAGIDYIFLDWSNNIDTNQRSRHGNHATLFIEDAGLKLAATFAQLTVRPNLSVFIGFPQDHAAVNDGRLQAKADQIHDQFVADPRFGPLMERYDGKPLLLVYTDTPSAYPHGVPPWDDGRFAVRWMTGFLTQQPTLLGPGLASRFGYWSWEDRGPPTISYRDGYPDAMTVVAAWRGVGSPGRDKTQTFVREWARARAVGPRTVFLNGWNEWKRHEQPSPEISKDIEPSTQFGTTYLDLARHEITLFKAGR